MDITLISIVVTCVAIVVTIVQITNRDWYNKVFKSNNKKKELPKWNITATNSRKKHISRINEYLDINLKNIENLGIMKGENPFLPTSKVSSFFVDTLCTTLLHNSKTYLLMPSGESKPDVEGVGRTAIVSRLLNIKPPYTKLIGLNKKHSKIQNLQLGFNKDSKWKLITSDQSFLSIEKKKLFSTSIKGERIDFIWDLARHLVRTTDLSYNSGLHRQDPEKRTLLLNLFKSISSNKIEQIYSSVNSSIEVNEIFILEKVVNPDFEVRIELIKSQKEIRQALIKSILVGSNNHGSEFWNRSAEKLKYPIENFINNLEQLPIVKKVIINTPETSIPSFIYDQVVKAIEANINNSPNKTELTQEKIGKFLLGVHELNKALFLSIPRVEKLRILVTSGELVFNDGSFWRQFARVKNNFELEILLLNPESKQLATLESTTYSDKEPGFIKNEILRNLQAIKAAKLFFEELNKEKQNKVSVKCRLYEKRPDYRITLIDDNRIIFSPYFEKSRTGLNTLFFDLSDINLTESLRMLEKIYDTTKANSIEVDWNNIQ
ncbi:MAG: hypothetical protein WBF67_07125 [Olleya sp.]